MLLRQPDHLCNDKEVEIRFRANLLSPEVIADL
jgi:hypothetical protein